MTTDTTARQSASGIARPEIRPTGLLRQSLAITRRNLIHIKRMPEMLMDVTIQPVMFVLLFAFVFGGSISVQGSPAGYREWLMGGIMGQTIAFASFIVAVGLTAGGYPVEVLADVGRCGLSVLGEQHAIVASRFSSAGRPSARHLLESVPWTRAAGSGR